MQAIEACLRACAILEAKASWLLHQRSQCAPGSTPWREWGEKEAAVKRLLQNARIRGLNLYGLPY
jgi:hypothetical protein